MLLTDGASAFALKGGAPVPGFVDPVLAHLAARAPDRGAEALRRLLDRPDASGSNPDDKTLLWAGRTLGGSTPDVGPGAVSEPGF